MESLALISQISLVIDGKNRSNLEMKCKSYRELLIYHFKIADSLIK